jgi:hypothetical protein
MSISSRMEHCIDTGTSGIVHRMGKLMGVLLIIYAVVVVYTYIMMYTLGYEYGDYMELGPAVVLSIFLQIFFGTMILIDFSGNLGRAIGFYALSIGSSRLINYIHTLFDPHGISFIFGLVMVIMSVNMLYTGITFVRGSARSRMGMALTSLLMLSLTIGSLYYYASTYDYRPEDLLEYFPDQCIICALYVLLFLMVGTETVRDSMPAVRYQKMLSSIRRVGASDPDSYILRSDAKVLAAAFEDRSSWTPVTDGGPALCEYKFRLTHHMNDTSAVRIQKWKDSEKLYITVTDSDKGSILNACRSAVTSVHYDGSIDTCSNIRFFGDGGLAIVFNVRDKVEEW